MKPDGGRGFITAVLLSIYASVAGAISVTDEFTFSCVPLTRQLSDPIVSPGLPSAHTHIVAGGTAFQRTMTINTAKNANETTCGMEIDKSNYWIPQLYHRMWNGSFELIEFEGSSIYYFNRACDYSADATECDSQDSSLAPPAGLRMTAGDPMLRTYNASDFAQRAISHMCMTEDGGSDETKHLPRQPCAKLRSQVFMPSCWDGENLDSPDHKSHMAYPVIGEYDKGVCPHSHPVAIYSIFLEFFFNTQPFPDFDNWVYAMGDLTGYGLHGDFINGWTDQAALQKAIATCTSAQGLNDPDCSITTAQTRPLTPLEQILEVPEPKEELGQHGPLAKLPGNNPVTDEPDNEWI